jgi:hypothetical protein
MPNIAYKKSIKTGNDYVDFAEVMGITFTVNTNYQIQLLNAALVMISDEKPKEGGFLIFDNKPFGYTHLGSKLWIKSIENKPIEINVSEG